MLTIDLAAGLEPPHRPAEALRGRRHQQVLGVDRELRAEAAAHVGRDRADLRPVHVERLRHVVPHVERDLRAHPDGERPVVLGDHGDRVRLHRRRRQALVHEPAAHDDLGALERVVVALGAERVGDVRALVGEEQRGAVARRRLEVGHHVEGLVVDLHELGGVQRLREALRDDDGERLADEPDTVARRGSASGSRPRRCRPPAGAAARCRPP